MLLSSIRSSLSLFSFCSAAISFIKINNHLLGVCINFKGFFDKNIYCEKWLQIDHSKYCHREPLLFPSFW